MTLKKSYCFILTLPFILTGCASAPTPEQQSAKASLRHEFRYDADTTNDFFTAIEKGQLKAVQLFLEAWQGYPYVETDQNGAGAKMNGHAALKAALSHPDVLQYLLRYSGTGPTAKVEVWSDAANPGIFFKGGRRSCIDPQTVNVLMMDAGVPATPQYMAGTLASFDCTESLKAFLRKYPAGASSPESDSFNDIRGEVFRAEPRLNDDDFKRLDATISVLAETSDAECSKDSLPACKAKDVYSSWKSKISKAHDRYVAEHTADQAKQVIAEKESAKRAVYKASPQSSFDQACSTTRDVAFFQAQVNQERKIGEESGVVNRVTLYQAGQRLAGAKDFLIRVKAEYKKRSGKSFDPTTCARNETKQATDEH